MEDKQRIRNVYILGDIREVGYYVLLSYKVNIQGIRFTFM